MLARLTLIIAAVTIAAGCNTPTRPVYNGGLRPGESRTLDSATALQPSEAGLTFQTDYAPPQPNKTIAGPTNRVRVDVPVAPERTYMSFSQSESVQDVRSARPARGTGSGRSLAGEAESIPTRAMAGESMPGTVYAPEQELSVNTSGGASRSTTASADRAVEHAANVNEAYHSAGITRTDAPANATGLADSDAVLEPAAAGQPLAAIAGKNAASLSRSGASREVSKAVAAQEAVEVNAPKQGIESASARDVGAPGQPLGMGTVAGSERFANASAVRARETSVAPHAYTGADAEKLLAQRDIVQDIGNAQFVVAANNSRGLLVYRRFQLSIAVASSDSAHAVDAVQVARRLDEQSNVQEMAHSDAPQTAETANSVLAPITAGNLERESISRGLRSGAWSSVTAATVAIAPPDLYVFKEARQVNERGMSDLRSAGILRDELRTSRLIAYRIHVFNAGRSVARNVRIFDRLDSSTTLLVNSMSTTSEAASAKYFTESRAVEVTLPRLDAGGYFIFEFYVEPLTAPAR